MASWPEWPQAKKDRALRVCRLIVRKDSEDHLSDVLGWGSGFHYGGGWIVTNSHVVGPDASNLPRMWVEFLEKDGDGRLVWKKIPPKHRVCFFARLRRQHPQADVRDFDIAVFNMIEDYGMMVAMVDVPKERALRRNFTSYCIHYGHINDGCPDQPQLSDGEQSEVLHIQANAVVLRRSPVSTVGGSSGSPVFNSENDELVGVHFSGNDKTMTGYAIHFQTVRDFLNKLIPVISHVRTLNNYTATYFKMTDGPLKEEQVPRIRQLTQGILDKLREIPWPVELNNVPS